MAEGLALLWQGRDMVHYSVLIPLRDATAAALELLPRLERVLERLVLPAEIICIDDGSRDERATSALCDAWPGLRLLRFDRPRGLSTSLATGIAAARGDLILAVSTPSRYSIEDLPQLIAWLSKHDLVVARREAHPIEALRQRVRGYRMSLAGQDEALPNEDVFWAARRSAFDSLSLWPGGFRWIAAAAALGGQRACDLEFRPGLPALGRTYQPNRLARFAVTWLPRVHQKTRSRAERPESCLAPRFEAALFPLDRQRLDRA